MEKVWNSHLHANGDINGRGWHFKNVNARHCLLKPKQCQMGQQVRPIPLGSSQPSSGQVGQKLDQLGWALQPSGRGQIVCNYLQSVRIHQGNNCTTPSIHPSIHPSPPLPLCLIGLCVWLAISKNKTKFSIIQKSISCVYWSVCLPLDCGFRLFHLLSLIPQTSFAWSSRLDASRMEWSGAAWIAATDVRVAVASSSGFNLERWALNAAPKAQVARSRSKYKKWVEWVMPCDSQNEGKHTELEHCWRAKKGVKFKLNISKN